MGRAFPVAMVVVAVGFSAVSTATYRSATLTFRYPAAWSVRRHVFAGGTTVRVRLASAGVSRSCRFAGWRPRGCRLPNGGVLVAWQLTSSWRPMPWSAVVRPGPCRTIGADETIVRNFSSAYSVEACLRDPSKAAERQVEAMLASARFPAPPS
jgi:hypothetical protein